MCGRNRISKLDNLSAFFKIMLRAACICFLLLSNGCAYRTRDGGNKAFNLRDGGNRALGLESQLHSPLSGISGVKTFHLAYPVLWNEAMQRKCLKRAENLYDEQGLMNLHSNPDYNIKSLCLHFNKYPPRANRADTKTENYHLRASFIPRLGKKSSNSVV
ncbi:hypothetical protein X975_01756, partial [Stegodyphus mimosarum]